MLELRLMLIHQVRNQGIPIAQACRELGMSRKTAHKWLNRFDTDPERSLHDRSRRPHSKPNMTPAHIEQLILNVHDKFGWKPQEIRSYMLNCRERAPSTTTIHNVLRRNDRVTARIKPEHRLPEHWHASPLSFLVKTSLPKDAAKPNIISEYDLKELVKLMANGQRRERRRAAVIILLGFGFSKTAAARILGSSPGSAKRYWVEFQKKGIVGILNRNNGRPRKCNDQNVRNGVFSLLHSPPSTHGINRTTWRLKDLKRVLGEQGTLVSVEVIREIIRSAGYRWRKAKKVLTSTDPDYRKKLSEIQSILSNLGEDDRFFSIDEFGPFAIKMQGGKRLVGPSEFPTVPQFQKSKGFLILTAALELSRNQVTHFYSERKNTGEMIKLLDVLLEQYKGCRKIYFSWDAASWHASKKLYKRVREVNDATYKRKNGTPIVRLAPLPACAQFLNVIESVFSGMARAVIHNSDYSSVDEARDAIDRYFRERNEDFEKHPKRAGKKIWGEELVPSEFSESHNCKDPKW